MNRRRRHNQGFTLTEMLVAVAIFVSLMAGIVLLFTGSLRAVRTGNQGMDLQEEARGALAILKEDLMTAFGSVAHSDANTFYGTPIGMTFIGLTRTGKTGDTHQARITYVLYTQRYPEPDSFSRFPTVENPADPTPRYTRCLLRYEEPNVGDLESFPIDWTGTNINETGISLDEHIDDIIDDIESATGSLNNVCRERIRAAQKREIWIRMLAGGDVHIPSAWNTYDLDGNLVTGVLEKFAEDYALSESVVSEFGFTDRYALAAVNNDVLLFDQNNNQAFFTYQCAAANAVEDPFAVNTRWWNDVRRTVNVNQTPTEYCRYYAQNRLPEVVRANLLFMKESPHPGAPDLQRRFNVEVLLPAGYRRSTP